MSQITLDFWKGYPKRIIYGLTPDEKRGRRMFVLNETFRELLRPLLKNPNPDKFDFDAPVVDRVYSMIDYWVPDEVFIKSNNEVVKYLISVGDKSIVVNDNVKDF